MVPIVMVVIGAVLGFFYGMVKRVGRDSGTRLRYAVMCALMGLVAGGVVAIGWTLYNQSKQVAMLEHKVNTLVAISDVDAEKRKIDSELFTNLDGRLSTLESTSELLKKQGLLHSKAIGLMNDLNQSRVK